MIKTVLCKLAIPGAFNLLLLATQQNMPKLETPPAPAPATAPAPQDLPDSERPRAQNLPSPQRPSATDTICTQRVHVHNRVGRDIKFIYSWVGPKSHVYPIKKKETIELNPVYCVSRLSVVTGAKTSSIEVKPGQDYDLIWSTEGKAFLFKETLPEGNNQKRMTPKSH